MQDVVEPLELPGALEGEHIERLLDDAQPGLVATRVPTDRTERGIADVEALVAEHDLVPDGDEGRRQRPCLRVRGAEQVVGQALGGLGSDARQARERLDEARDGLDQGGRHRGRG